MIEISDDVMSDALAFQASGEHAMAKTVYERLGRQRKTLQARLEREANEKTLRERESFALNHPHMTELNRLYDAAEEAYNLARDKKDSADTITQVWRTIQADIRAAERTR